MTSIAASDDLTQRKLVPTFARANMTSSQPNLYLGQWVYQNLKVRRVAMILQDYAYGWESGGGFQYAIEKAGGKVVQKLYAPLSTTDYTPFVNQFDKNVDAVYAMLVGSNVPRFHKTYSQLGLAGKVPLLGGPDMADEDAAACGRQGCRRHHVRSRVQRAVVDARHPAVRQGLEASL